MKFPIPTALLLAPLTIFAADRYWDGTDTTADADGGDGTWDNATLNWDDAASGGAPFAWSNVPADTASFGGVAGTVSLGTAIEAAGLTFTTTGYTISGNILTLSGAPVLSAASGITATLTSSLASAVNVGVSGGGTISFNPAAGHNDGLIGGVTVGGTGTVLELRGNNMGGSTVGPGALTIEAGAVVRAFTHNTLGNGSGTALTPLLINGGTFEADQYNHVNTITMSGGTLGIRAGVTQVDGMDMKFRTVNPSITTLANAATATISSRLTANVPLTITTADGAAASDLLVSGAVAGSSSVTKEGPGTLTFSTQKTYTGGTVVNGGILDLTGGGGGAGTIRGTVTVNNAMLRLSSQDNTGFNTGADRLAVININAGGVLHINNTNNQTLGNAAINLTGGSITGIASSNLDFFQGTSSLNSLASATTSTVSGTRLSIRQSPGLTITVADGGAADDLTISSLIVSNGFPAAPLVKAGDGTLVLFNRNTMTGGTIVNGGILRLDSGNAATSVLGTGTVTINAGATLETAVNSFGWNYQNNLVINGGTLRQINDSEGPDSHLRNVTLTAGTMTGVDAAKLFNLHGDVTVDAAATPSSINTAQLNLAATAGVSASATQNTFTVADGAAALDLDVTSVVAGGSGLIKAGPGTMRLTQNNTFSGGVTINDGTLLLASTDDGTGTVRGAVTVNAGGTLNWAVRNSTGYNANSISSLTINGGTVGGNDFDQHFYHNAGTIPVTMTGGTLLLGGTSGSFANQFRNAPITVTSSSTTTAQILGVTANAGMGIRDGSTQTFNVQDGTQDVDLLVDVIISQNNGVSGITKTGDGTMVLTRNNTYAGQTTVSGGTLLINGTHNPAGLIVVESGATLGGSGSVGDVTLADGATLSPGNSAGQFTVNRLALNPASDLFFELGAPNLGQNAGSDFVTVRDDLTLHGTINVVAIAGFGTPVSGDKWLLMSVANGIADNGVTLGSTPALSGGLTFDLDVSNGQDVFLTVVPEAGTGVLTVLGLLLLARFRRSR